MYFLQPGSREGPGEYNGSARVRERPGNARMKLQGREGWTWKRGRLPGEKEKIR